MNSHKLMIFTFISMSCHTTFHHAAHTPPKNDRRKVKQSHQLPAPVHIYSFIQQKAPSLEKGLAALQSWNPHTKKSNPEETKADQKEVKTCAADKMNVAEIHDHETEALTLSPQPSFSRPPSPHQRSTNADYEITINWMPITYYFKKNPKPGEILTSSPCYNQQ